MQIDSELHNLIVFNSVQMLLALLVLAGIASLVFRRHLLKARWSLVLLTAAVLGSFSWYCHLKSNYTNQARVFLDRLKEAFTDGSYKHILYFDEHTLEKRNCDLSTSDYEQIQELIFTCEYTIMPRVGIAASDPVKLYFHDYDELWLNVYKYSVMEIHWRGSMVMLSGNSGLYEHIQNACLKHLDGS